MVTDDYDWSTHRLWLVYSRTLFLEGLRGRTVSCALKIAEGKILRGSRFILLMYLEGYRIHDNGLDLDGLEWIGFDACHVEGEWIISKCKTLWKTSIVKNGSERKNDQGEDFFTPWHRWDQVGPTPRLLWLQLAAKLSSAPHTPHDYLIWCYKELIQSK